MKTLALLALAALAACGARGAKPQIHHSGTLTASQTFQFGNFTELVVEAPGAAYRWEEYNVRDGTAFNPPYDELHVGLASGDVTATDRECSNGELIVAGTRHRGTRFRMRADARVEVVAP